MSPTHFSGLVRDTLPGELPLGSERLVDHEESSVERKGKGRIGRGQAPVGAWARLPTPALSPPSGSSAACGVRIS